MCGHANPGSILKRKEALALYDVDIWGLAETKLNATGQATLNADVGTEWTVVFGRPQPNMRNRWGTESNTARSGTPGGVALLGRRPLPLSEVEVWKGNPHLVKIWRRMWTTGRVVHALTATGSGNTPAHLFEVYGWSGALQGREPAFTNTERLLTDLALIVAALGDVPIVIMGDFNTTFLKSPALAAMLHTGRFFDAGLAFAERTRTALENTHFPPYKEASRIDSALVNIPALAALMDFRVLGDDENAFGQHRAIILAFDWQRTRQSFSAWSPPKAILYPDKLPLDAELDDDIFQQCFAPHAEAWIICLETKDSEGILRIWHRIAEAAYCKGRAHKRLQPRGLRGCLHGKR